MAKTKRKTRKTKRTRKIKRTKSSTLKRIKRKTKNYYYKGGGNTLNLQAMPNQVYSFPAGCNNASSCAQSHTATMVAKQNELNNTLSGGKKIRSLPSSRRRRKNYFGGDPTDYYSCEAQNTNIVPVVQFSNSGPNVSPLNANSGSVITNTTLISGKNNALNDCYATNSCPV
jgi:hypothetical protein